MKNTVEQQLPLQNRFGLKSSPVVKKLMNNSFATGLNFLSRWLFNFILSKQLSNQLFGVFSLLYACGNLMMNAFGFGANLHIIHAVSKDKKMKYTILANSLVITLAITLLTLVIWVSILILFPEINNILLYGWAILFGWATASSAVIFAFFKGLGKFSREAQGYLIFTFAMMALLAVLWALSWPSQMFILMGSLSFCTLLTMAYGIRKLKNQLLEEKLSWKEAIQVHELKAFWKEKLPFGLHELQGAIYTHINILILALLLTSADLGIFKSVQLLIVPVSILPSIVSQVALNQLSSKLKNKAEFLRTFRRFFLMSFLSGLIIFIVYMIFGEWVINWVYGTKLGTAPIGILLLCFALTFLFKFISSNYGVLITSAGNQSFRVKITLASIVVSVSLTAVLGHFYGMKGAAIAMASANAVILMGYAIYGELFILKKQNLC
ncbi:MAG: lipopolysaccharide biosynthesis protein [Flavobacteriales bacterium]